MPEKPPTERVIKAYEQVLTEIFTINATVASGGKDTTPERAAELYRKVNKAEELLGPAMARVVERKAMQAWEKIKKRSPLSGEPIEEVPF